MNKLTLLLILTIALCGCNILKYKFNVIPRVKYDTMESERIADLYLYRKPIYLYGECIEKKITPYIKNKVIDKDDYTSLMISKYSSKYITTPERASPYNYHNFVKFIKSGGEYDDHVYENNKELMTKALQHWTTVLYDTCGQYAYTVEERCAALSAVELTPDWCIAYSK